MLYATAITLLISVLAFLWLFSGYDFLNIGALIKSITGFDAISARSSNQFVDYLGAAISLGVILGTQGLAIAHELTHQTENPAALGVGEWVFALSLGTNFSTDHVFAHHHNVGYPDIDPVTVTRGTTFFKFLMLGSLIQWLQGWNIEKARIYCIGKSTLSLENRIVRAYLRAFLVIFIIVSIIGMYGLVFYLLSAAIAKIILESFNYFTHYGLVREQGSEINLRHTWSNHSVWSSILLFNIGRHAAHHSEGGYFYELNGHPNAPNMPYGFITMTVLTWIQPLFYRAIIPKLKEWDLQYATLNELRIVQKQNKHSKLAPLLSSHSIHPEKDLYKVAK